MPEYLTPGVYVEETSFRSRSIEGVPTSTFGMAGRTEYGPVPYIIPAAPNQPQVVMTPRPTLVTSFTEFERAYGGVGDSGNPNYLAYAARAFFDNGGRRLYVSRVFDFTRGPAVPPATEGPITVDENIAKLVLGGGGGGGGAAPATWRARWPGLAGASISVLTVFRRSKNVVVGGRLRGVYPGAAIEVVAGGANQPAPKDTDPPTNLGIVARIGTGADLGYLKNNQTVVAPGAADAGYHVTVDVTVRMGDRIDTYAGLELSAVHPRSVANVLQASRPVDDLSLVWLDMADPQPEAWLPVLTALAKAPNPKSPPQADFLTGGGDGVDAGPDVLLGEKADPDDPDKAATGLEALGEIDDIAIVACPDTVRFADLAAQGQAVDNLIAHCEASRYRIAVVDPPANQSISQVRDFRGRFDSSYGALYYPWVEIVDPTAKNDPGAPTPKLQLPPSGFAAGIYARSDIARGVHKAPANEVVHGITKFTQNITFDRQSVLNPEGINALRFFEGRSNRVWGARTMSSDPEWKYVNVRRLFIYLEHSIDKATQWAVFEPNNERLWASIRQSVEDFLLVTWRSGALMGTKPEEAYFVRCDRTTMSQNDLDNGRLICLVGVAPTYPAEFVIFRIGQWTADAQQS